jgi:Heavy-metal resistance
MMMLLLQRLSFVSAFTSRVLSLGLLMVGILGGLLLFQSTAPVAAQGFSYQTLNLSADQEQGWKRTDADFKACYQQIGSQIVQDKQRMRLLMMQPSPDVGQINTLRQRIHLNQMKLHEKATQSMLEKRKLLNSDQLKMYMRYIGE